jgi:hypothetical protein
VVDGVLLDSYQEVATKSGIFGNDNEAHYAMTEAINTLKTPAQLRILFVLLLINNCVPHPLLFWQTFQKELCFDFTLWHHGVSEIAVEYALDDLGSTLEEHGKQLLTYGLPDTQSHGHEIEHELYRWGQDCVRLAERANMAMLMFNAEQRRIYDNVLSAILNDRAPSPFFIDSKAGTGKTYLVNTICDQL